MKLNYKNAKYTSQLLSTIDCEIDHPTFGWIPFTVNPNDITKYVAESSETASELFDRIKAEVLDIPLDIPLETIDSIRGRRNELLDETDYIMQRHTNEEALGLSTTLNSEQYVNWLQYRQALRDFPSTYSPTTIESIEWPTKPE